jgi:2-amino-4-hydroxy-6-hydroxymethyldihydropteridine diphosphokinase
MTAIPQTTFIALGSNKEPRKESLKKAIADINRIVGPVNQVSSLYHTKPLIPAGEDPGNYPEFLNAVLKCSSILPAEDILKTLHQIESSLGRVRVEGRWWEPRTIDLDLLFVGQSVVSSNLITLPHPRIQERDFVLAPLAEIAPDYMHPAFQATVKQLLSALALSDFEPYIISSEKNWVNSY